jgi:hypothetical protein
MATSRESPLRAVSVADVAAFSLVLRMGFAREVKGEDPTSDLSYRSARIGL